MNELKIEGTIYNSEFYLYKHISKSLVNEL